MWLSFGDDFYLNFIKDDRYLYLLKGLGNTLLITVLAAIMGIVLGFIVAIIRSSHDKTGSFKLVDPLCRLYLTVIRGTPTMIQLLIINFVVFGSANVNGIIVGAIAFGLNSGAYVAEIFRSGIMSVDQGQFEAGRSLGLNFTKTMRLIIMPQAFKNVLPALANEFITLLKETSIIGTIGMMDLTRGASIIQSRTYQPFMPLLAAALIYLALVLVMTKLVSRLERRLRSNER
ncbi:MAG: amino acid ABC transporter permease [Lachnospiraceae bacterium]|nr:amino acid ABC transporter permease [Lachnospiraceae bacterium]